MKWAVYNLLFAAVYPFLLPGFMLRMLRRGGYARRFADRFALYPQGMFPSSVPFGHDPFDVPPAADAFVWVHAVSVGEVQVAGQLMREWRAAEPGVRFCFSTTSSTGWKMAEKEVGQHDALVYNPLDFPNFVKSALKTVRPRAVVLTESEIWPNFIRQARKYGIPVFLVNARVSDRSAPRYRLARWFFADVFRCFLRIFAQSDLDKARLVAAGAPADAVEVTGSFKFDVARRSPEKEAELRAWLAANGVREDAKVIVGGSTWPGEDEVLLKIYKRLLEKENRNGRLVLVIAPRHFEKADAVEANVRKAGFECVRRSRGISSTANTSSLPLLHSSTSPLFHSSTSPLSHSSTSPLSHSSTSPLLHSSTPVFLADTTGELMGLYGIADAVFVGKSLCARGAQNMIEPCLCGKPTFVGQHVENFRPVMDDLLAADAIVRVSDAAELERRLADLLADGGDGGLGERAKAAVERRRGVVAKCVAGIRGRL